MQEIVKQLEALGKAHRECDFSIQRERLARIQVTLERALALYETSGLPLSWGKKLLRIILNLRSVSLFVPKPVRLILRPTFITGGVGVFAFVGWVGATSVFSRVLPGDSLYGMKLASERAQLTFTRNPQSKAQLGLEFASRRLEEAAKVAESSLPDRGERAGVAVEQFKNQMSGTKLILRNLEGAKQSDAVATAKIVDRKATEYQTILDGTGALLSGSLGERVREAKDAAEEASFIAVTVLVKERQSGQVSFEEVHRKVGEKLHELEGQILNLSKRLSVIPNEAFPEVETIGGPTIGLIYVDFAKARQVLEEGKNLFAHGGFETALEKYREGIGFMNQVEWAVGLYEKALVDRAALEKAASVQIKTSEGG